MRMLLCSLLIVVSTTAHAQQAEAAMAAELARINAAEASGQVASKPFIAEARAAMAVGDGKTGAAAAKAAVRAAVTPMLTEQYTSMGISAAAQSATGDKK